MMSATRFSGSFPGPKRRTRQGSARRWVAVALGVLVGAYGLVYIAQRPSYAGKPRVAASTFEEFVAAKIKAGQQIGVRPGNEERLVRITPGQSEYAVLFIHGYGASRAEGEAVFDPLARKFKANTYYLRLPGHGANAEQHAATRYRQYVSVAEEALFMMPKLGKRIIVAGASTGGMIATYLAARHPQRVHGLILASPFYAFRDPTGAILQLPGAIHLLHAMYGRERDASWKKDPERRRQPGYEKFWLTKQKFSALVPLDRLRRLASRPAVYRRVTAATLLLYYYKDEEHQDATISIPAALDAFAAFGRASKPHPLNRSVAIADGHHILTSRYVRSDKQRVQQEANRFMLDLIAHDTKASK